MSEAVRLSYKDDDGDEITVSSNREVLDAMQSCCAAKDPGFASPKILKFAVRDPRDEQQSGSENSEPNSPMKEVLL